MSSRFARSLTCLTLAAAVFTTARAVAAQEKGAPPEKPAATAPQDPAAKQPPAQDPAVEELRRRIDLLAAEVERLRSGEQPEDQALTDQQRAALGLGPAAASVYEKPSGVSFAGYGELLFQRTAGSDDSGRDLGASSSIDLLRAVLYTGYRFSDKFLFNSEFEWEHAGGEVSVEFAYLEYLAKPSLSVRAGMLLVPLGLVNEFHEPTVFIGTLRPETERRIIPSTWRENGAGIVGSSGRFSYRAYLLNGMNAEGFTADGLRGGRQGGAEALANDWAFAGRLDMAPIPGVFAGVGLYRGNSGQDQFGSADVGTTIVELHGQAQVRGFDVRGVFAHAAVDDVAALNQARGLEGADGIGESMNGGYAQVAYNVLSQTPSTLALSPYYRFEQVNTQSSVPAGFTADPERDGRWHTLGVELKPIGHIVLKTDYQWISNRARTGRDRFNVALGYSF
jgi:hypothetical protein